MPHDYYPWAVFYRKSLFEENGYEPPDDARRADRPGAADAERRPDPFAFADKDGWPAMGTFDILNMRINGYDFHMSLMAGEEAWDSAEVKTGLRHLARAAALPPGRPAGPHLAGGRAASLQQGESGMYLLGTFVVDAVPGRRADDLDFFTFPEIDSAIGADAHRRADRRLLHVAGAGRTRTAPRSSSKYLGSAAAAGRRQRATPTPR